MSDAKLHVDNCTIRTVCCYIHNHMYMRRNYSIVILVDICARCSRPSTQHRTYSDIFDYLLKFTQNIYSFCRYLNRVGKKTQGIGFCASFQVASNAKGKRQRRRRRKQRHEKEGMNRRSTGEKKENNKNINNNGYGRRKNDNSYQIFISKFYGKIVWWVVMCDMAMYLVYCCTYYIGM